jgi:hypothetical protein
VDVLPRLWLNAGMAKTNKPSSNMNSGARSTSDTGSRKKSTRETRKHGDILVTLRFTESRPFKELPIVRNPII